jgi:hypothetical protein
MNIEAGRAMKLAQRLFCAAVAVYVAVFAWRQTSGFHDPHVMEWDARGFTLVAWRFHGTGLFPGDDVVDFAASWTTPLWRLVFWVGTLFTDPVTFSKLLPFALSAVVLWHGFQLGRRLHGPAVGAAVVLALAHCLFIWNRLQGGNPRAFAFPLVMMFLRYAATGGITGARVSLLLLGLGHPPSVLVCAPAWLVLHRRPADLAVAAVAVVAAGWGSLFPDPRFGHPLTLAQAAQLGQLGPGSALPYFYPRPAPWGALLDTLQIAWRAESWPIPAWAAFTAAGLALLAAGRRLRTIPKIFGILPITALLAFAAAWLLAYRLYLPSRMIQQAWPLVMATGLPLVLALTTPAPRAAPFLAAVFTFAFGGWGLPRAENLTDFAAHDVAAIGFLETLPKDILVATHPERASYVQIFAHRRALFSASLNMPHQDVWAFELERRIGDFYRAYYAPDFAAVLDFGQKYHVDYLIADERDFGPETLERARYYEPWGTLAQRLTAGPHALLQPPSDRVVYRDGTRLVVSLHQKPDLGH